MNRNIFFAAILVASAAGAAAYAKGPKGDHFSRFDQDGDGKVAVSELDERHRQFLAGADKDADGFITQDEMTAIHEARRAEHEARRFPDANNDGKVSRREFEDAARDKFNELDKDGDGLLTREEMDHHRGGWRKHR